MDEYEDDLEFDLPELDKEDVKKAQLEAEKDIKKETDGTIPTVKSPTRRLSQCSAHHRDMESEIS